MKYQVTIKIEVDSDVYIRPPESIEDVKQLVSNMIYGGADWPKSTEIEVILVEP